jgi:DNA ligase-1
LFRALDETTATSRKIEAMAAYFGSAPPADAAWAVYLLSGRRLKRLVPTRELRAWTAAATGYPEWLVEETHSAVGDLAETVALLFDGEADATAAADDTPLHVWMGERITGLRRLDADERQARVTAWWRALATDDRFVLNKLMTGSFRVGVSQRLVVRALASHTGLDRERLAHRLTGDWTPSAAFFERLTSPADQPVDAGRPYPFFLASPIEEATQSLGEPADWLVEWKWDGIRAQLLLREAATFVWSRGEEPLDGRFPEIERAADALAPGCVLDGEILAWRDGGPLPFSRLQRRIGRLKPDRTIINYAPVIFLAFDLLESDGIDRRGEALEDRRELLQALLADAPGEVQMAAPLAGADWHGLDVLRGEARERRTEGFVLKRWGSPYRVGRTRGDWWKWKVAPHTVDAVLVYAEPGHGRRSNLLTDYTFAVWHEGALVPVAKAYSGLVQQEIESLDRWIRRHTTDRFGPVRQVEPAQVFELACDGVQRSQRHKAGLTLRFPRIARWRQDLAPDAADRLADVEALVDE